MSIRELETIETIPHGQGEEIRVALKSAGPSVAVDARIHVTDEAPAKMVKRGSRWVEAPAYGGPTKAGLWLRTSSEAFAVAEAIAYTAGILKELEDRYAGDMADVPTDELIGHVHRLTHPEEVQAGIDRALELTRDE